jgi:hypothetical protein
MPFPDNQGGAWYVWGNGFAMKLYTHTIRDDGLVAGEIDDGVRPLVTFDGQFDDTTKKFEFVRTSRVIEPKASFWKVLT